MRTTRGFTLIEVIAVIVVLGVVAGLASPIMLSMSETYRSALDQRTAAESASIALDRVMRIVRETPPVVGSPGTPDITTATATRYTLGDGTSIELLGTNLMLTIPGEQPAVLCSDVTAFELTYLKDDSTELNLGAGDALSDVHKVDIRIACGPTELRAGAFLREKLAS